MSKEAQLFLQILNEISDGKIQAEPTELLAVIFDRGLEPLDFELVLYSLEATTGRKLKQAFYEGKIENYFATPIESFVRRFLSKRVSRDPLYIAKVFKKFRRSTQWEHTETAEPGNN